jgi:hypothetical protein
MMLPAVGNVSGLSAQAAIKKSWSSPTPPGRAFAAFVRERLAQAGAGAPLIRPV